MECLGAKQAKVMSDTKDTTTSNAFSETKQLLNKREKT